MSYFVLIAFLIFQVSISNAAIGVEWAASETVTFSRVTQIDGTTKGTVCAWMKRKTTTDQIVWARDIAASSYRYGIYAWSDGTIYFIVDVGPGNAYESISNNSTEWQHLAMTFDGTQAASDRIRCYVNGVYINGSTVGSVPTAIPSHANPFIIGSGNGSTGSNGWIDDPRVYDYILTDNEILSLASSRSRLKIGTPVLWPDFDIAPDLVTCAGAVIPDRSGNGYTGTCANGPVFHSALLLLNYP